MTIIYRPRWGLLPALSALLLLPATMAMADGDLLQQLHQSSRQEDPMWLGARQTHAAALENVPQARARLRPNLSLSANARRNWQEIDAAGGGAFGGNQDLAYNNTSVALQVRQTLYNRDQYLALDQAGQMAMEADSRLRLAEQQLILRLAAASFAILSANEDLAVAYSEQRALKRQLQQAEQRLEIGLGTIIDVEEARAAYDLAIARGLEAENSQAIALEGLREISTDAIGARLLQISLDQDMPLPPPQPADREYWQQKAIDHNLEVLAERQLLAQAEQQVQRAKSGHYPTLDLVGSQSFDDSGGRFGTTETDTTRLGIEFNLPLYTGGGTSSTVRAAIAQRDAAKERLEQAKRGTKRNTSESYLNVLNSIKRSESLSQAVRSSETALAAIRTGFDVGTRTSVDVVDAERSLSSAKRDLAQARHAYVLDLMRLYMAAGALDTSHLVNIDRWLIKRTDSDNATNLIDKPEVDT